MKLKRILVMMVMVMVMVMGLASCAQPEKVVETAVFHGTPQADSVVLDITTEPLEMNSMLIHDAVSMGVLTHCMSGITRLDQNDGPVADLADRWEINEDNTLYTIHLRKDAKWSNGDPVLAKDFAFAWVTQMKPEMGSTMAFFLYENIKNGEAFYQGEADESELGIEVVDDYTLRIEWARPMADADGLFLLSQAMYFPVNQRAYEQIGPETYGKDADKLVTNGAYRLTEWTHDSHIVLEKSNDYHNAAKVRIPKAKLVMIGDTNTRLNAFMTGEIDLCNVYSEQIAQVKGKDEKALRSYIDGGSWYLSFNMNNPHLANLNLRKALAHAIDVQSLLDNVIADGSVAADGLVPGVIAGADGKRYAEARGSLFAYDLDEAKKSMELALSELGVSAADLKLTLDVPDTSYSQNQAAYIQEQWKKNLGIDVQINAQAWKALHDAKTNGDFMISIEANGPTKNNAMTFLELFISGNANNLSKYASQAYDSLLAQANEEIDPAKRQSLMIEAEKILLGDMGMGPLYFTCTTYAVSDKLDGLVRTPFQYFNILDATIKA